MSFNFQHYFILLTFLLKLATMLRMPALSRSALSMWERTLSTDSGLVVILLSL